MHTEYRQGLMGKKYDADKGGVTLVSPKQKTQIGTWSKQTMYQPGKVHQVAKETQGLNYN